MTMLGSALTATDHPHQTSGGKESSMRLHLLAPTAFGLGAAFALATPAVSGDLPQKGSFTTHSPGTYNAEAAKVGEKHFTVSGTTQAVMYNDAGSGPLHRGSAVCKWWSDDVNGSYRDNGICAYGDAGGADKIFVEWSGKGSDNVAEQGAGTITGGTGKYDGIQGKMAYQCKPIDPAQRLFDCTQRFDYQLKAASATR
jgi:hypothetical protein